MKLDPAIPEYINSLMPAHAADIADMVNKKFFTRFNRESIIGVMQRYGIKSGLHRRIVYTPEQLQWLKDNVVGTRMPLLTERFNNHFGTNFSRNRISGICSNNELRNGLSSYLPGDRPRITPTEHVQFLQDNSHLRERDLFIAFNEHFNLNEKTDKIRGIMQRYGIVAKRIRAQDYTPSQIQFVKDNSSGRSFEEIAELFNKHFSANILPKQIQNLMARHGIRRYTYTLSSNSSNKSRPRGGSPKDRKNTGGFGVRVPIGSERIIDKRGFIQIKISESEWKRKHIFIWEQANGEIPEGYNVIFLDGNKSNFELNNLALATRNEITLLHRRGLQFNDTEMTKVGLAMVRHRLATLGALTKGMSKKEKANTIQLLYYRDKKAKTVD